MHNEMQSKQALCQCENRRSSFAENYSSVSQWSKMFLLVSNVSFMDVIIVLLTVGLIYETNVRPKIGRTVVSTQNLEFINMDVSGGYDQISRLV